jgi:ABC-type nitrate/sulfonate/bicarbonate transport system ATPase subunit
MGETPLSHIRIENLYKSFINRRHSGRVGDEHVSEAKISVLDNVSLEFGSGEMVCLLGPSGCGKSTLLRIIAGFDIPTSGSVLIDGKPVAGPSEDNIFVYQQSGLLPWMTVWQNVELGLRKMPEKAARKEAIQEYIDIVELTGFEHYYPHQLSGGMQRRAELARALAVNPEMLIMDEPFSGLDFLTHMKMREEVVNMHQFIGKTVLVVTHSIDDALVMGDHIVVMTERPSRVKMDMRLDIPHPRDLSKNEELSKLRDEIYLMLGVSYVA